MMNIPASRWQGTMQQQDFSKQSLSGNRNHSIPLYVWEAGGEPSAVIQIFHGLGEHAARYNRFAKAATARGFAVGAHDHRGHGPETEHPGLYAPSHGWQLLIDDGHLVTDFLRDRYPGKPVVLLGHSMGSFIAQTYAMHFSEEIAVMILSGSTWPARLQIVPGRLLAGFMSLLRGRRGKSAMLDNLGFGAFNRPFEPARTEFDWLSRDTDEVDKYVADPLCGGPNTIGLWCDFLGGLLEVSSRDALQRIRKDLPILITGGSDDPVGGSKGMLELADAYQASGHLSVDKAIYANGRHEMLNETNRDEFTADLLTWIKDQLAGHQV
jgi:alpha-beta hydrolase superfamily lysophospholipase